MIGTTIESQDVPALPVITSIFVVRSCAFDPNVPDKAHKVVYCPYKQLRGQLRNG